ncbi:MAG TPA: DMT family transporter [Allosphingosinicella sp.]|nr:DMT family transporter [Allosphingosinicella sp.]
MSGRGTSVEHGNRVRHAPRRALLIALAGFTVLAIGDAVVKSMAGLWPGSAMAALRYLMGAAGLAVLVRAWHGREAFVFPKPWVQLGRGLAVGTATATFFLSLRVMPLADATAIVFTSPIWTLILSFLFLRERPKAAVLVSIVLATLGVLLILRPNVLAFGWEAMLPLVAALAMACLFILNRRVGGLAPVIVMQFVVAVMALPILFTLAAFGHYSGDPAQVVTWPRWSVVLRCAVVAVTATLGHWCIFRATELASAATIAPMTYVQLLVAVIAGALFFGDLPTWTMAGGAGLIITGGLWLWHKQRPRASEAADGAAPT